MSYLRQVACYACEAIGAAAVLWRPSPSEEESFHIAGWDEGDFMSGEQDPYCAPLSDESRCHWANWNKFIRSKAGADASVYPFLADLEPYNSATFTRVNTTFTTESPETLFFSKHEDIVYWSWKFALEKSSESICYKPCGRPEPTPEPSPSPPEPSSSTSPEPEPSSSTSPEPEPPTPITPTPDPPEKMTLTLTAISLTQDVSSFKFSKATGSTADGSYAQLLFTMVGKREDYAFAVIGITIKNPSLTLGANNIRFKLGKPTTEGIECEVTVNGKSKKAFVAGMGYFPEFDEAIEIDGIEIGKAFKDITVSVTPEDKDRRTFLGWAQDITKDKDDFICVKDGAIVPSSNGYCPSGSGAIYYYYSKSKGSINVIDLDKETGTAAIPFTSYIRPYSDNVIKDAYSWGNGQFKKSTTDPYDSFIGELKNTGTNEWLISSKNTAAFQTTAGTAPEPFEIQCNTTVSGYTNVLGPKTAGFIGTVSDEEVTMFQGMWGTCNPSENHEQKHAKGDFLEFRLDDNTYMLHYSFDTHDGQGGKVVRAAGVRSSNRLPMLKVVRTYGADGNDTYGRKLMFTYKRSEEATADDWRYNNPFPYLYTGVTYPLGPITTKIYDDKNYHYMELQELDLRELTNEGIHEVELNVSWSKVDMVYVATPVDRDDDSKFVAAGIFVNSTYSETAFVDIPVGGIMMYKQNRITQKINKYENIGTSLGFKKAQGRHNTWTTDDFYIINGAGSKVRARAMTYQNYDKGHPSVLINPSEAFVEPLENIPTADPFSYTDFMIVVVKNGTSTEGATQREDTDVIDSVYCEDKYTIFKGSGTDEFALGKETTILGTANMLMRRVKPISNPNKDMDTDGNWFTATTYDKAVYLNNGWDSIASPWRSWEPLGISYSIWEVAAGSEKWVNHPAFIMRAKMTPGYIGCFLVLVDSSDRQVSVIPFRPVEFDMSNVTVGTHEFNAWPKVQMTESYMVTGGSGVIYNLIDNEDIKGQPAGTLADILFYNMTGSAVYATVVDHENNATQYAYLRLENIPWRRGQLSKGDFIGTSMMATENGGVKQFAGTINGLSKSISRPCSCSRPRITTDKRSNKNKNKNKIYMM